MQSSSSTYVATKTLLLTGLIIRGDYRKLIVGLGVSGCGKSSTFIELNKLVKSVLYVEPEENQLPNFIKNCKNCDNFTILMAFRSLRVPGLLAADEMRRNGHLVLVDSYYDKIMYYYIGSKGFEWLINPKDQYFNSLIKTKKIDKDVLPDADVIVLFNIDYSTWYKFIKKRNRQIDQDPQFLASYNTFKDIERATEMLCKEKNIKLIKFNQEYSSPKIQAKKLKLILEQHGIL